VNPFKNVVRHPLYCSLVYGVGVSLTHAPPHWQISLRGIKSLSPPPLPTSPRRPCPTVCDDRLFRLFIFDSHSWAFTHLTFSFPLSYWGFDFFVRSALVSFSLAYSEAVHLSFGVLRAREDPLFHPTYVLPHPPWILPHCFAVRFAVWLMSQAFLATPLPTFPPFRFGFYFPHL